jgi:sulfide:quinone oxidoreductase
VPDLKKVVIVGGGVGGTIVANALAGFTNGHDAEITLISDSTKHVYQPSYISVALSEKKPDALIHEEKPLLSKKIRFVNEKATKVDTKNRQVEWRADKKVDYDILVISAGARYNPSEIQGYEKSAHHFYDIQHSLKLRKALQQFTGGKILIGVGSVPYKCPPAPLEFAFLLEEYFKKKGMRNVVDIEYFYPINGVFTIKSVEPMLSKLLDEKNIPYHTFFNPETVDPEKNVVHSMEGESLEYDLLVMTPPHRGASVVEDSGLGDNGGWLPTDRVTLKAKGYDEIYGVGDCTNLPVSKSGSAAHFQSKIVAEDIAAEIYGETNAVKYDGHVECFLETGYGKGITLNFDYKKPPKPTKPNRIAHWEKEIVNRLYWTMVPKARV